MAATMSLSRSSRLRERSVARQCRSTSDGFSGTGLASGSDIFATLSVKDGQVWHLERGVARRLLRNKARAVVPRSLLQGQEADLAQKRLDNELRRSFSGTWLKTSTALSALPRPESGFEQVFQLAAARQHGKKAFAVFVFRQVVAKGKPRGVFFDHLPEQPALDREECSGVMPRAWSYCRRASSGALSEGIVFRRFGLQVQREGRKFFAAVLFRPGGILLARPRAAFSVAPWRSNVPIGSKPSP